MLNRIIFKNKKPTAISHIWYIQWFPKCAYCALYLYFVSVGCSLPSAAKTDDMSDQPLRTEYDTEPLTSF